jgi:outer membrane protein assembly factor BamB
MNPRRLVFEAMTTPSLHLTTLSLCLWGALAPLQAASPANWPAWRGPLASGVAPDAHPPIRWSESENVQWKVSIPGRGTSTPVIWGDQVFILTAVPTGPEAAAEASEAGGPPTDRPDRPDRPRRGGPGGPGGGAGGMVDRPTRAQQFTVISFDRKTGKQRWMHSPRTQLPHEGHHKDHGFASASPVTDGQHLIVSFGSFGLYGYDLKGKLLWEKDLGDMRTRNSFGEGSSPALDGNTVVVLWDHEGDDFIVALDKRTGRELWRQHRDEPTGWCTPLIVSHGGRKQVIVNGTHKVRSYDLQDGKLLWECGGQTVNAIPSAVSAGDRVFLMSGYRGNALQALRLDRSGDLTGTDGIVWSHAKSTPYVPSPLLVGNTLYFLSNNSAMLSAFDAGSGKAHFEAERLEGLNGVYASPVAADGRVYVVGRDGNTAVLRQGNALEVLAKNRLDDGFDASPAIVGKQLFLRGRQSLYCIVEK